MYNRAERQIERSLDNPFGPNVPKSRSTPAPINAQLRERNKAAKNAAAAASVPAVTDSSMSDVAPKGRKAAAPAASSDNMEDIEARRRSERIAAAGLAKAQHKESEEEKKRWDAEVKKAVAEGKKYKKWVAIKVRELHANATVDELFELVDILSAAGEKYASLEASVFAYEKQGEEEEAKRTAEVDEAALVLGLTDFVKEGYKVGEGLRFSGDTKGNAILLASSLLEEMGAPVPEDPHFAPVNFGGRRRKTKKNKKSRRKTKRGSGDEPPRSQPFNPPPAQQPNPPDVEEPPNKRPKPNPRPAPPAAPVEQPDVEMGGRRKTKRFRRTTRR